MCHKSYKKYKRDKREFHNELQTAHNDFITMFFKDIDEAAECDVRLFWKLIKRQRPRSSRVCPEIEIGTVTFSDPGDIANAFAQHFENVYNSNDNDSFNSDFYYNI